MYNAQAFFIHLHCIINMWSGFLFAFSLSPNLSLIVMPSGTFICQKRKGLIGILKVIQLKQCGVDSDFFLPKANLSVHELFKTIYCQLCYEAFIHTGGYFYCKLVHINFYDANFLYMYCYVLSHFPNLTRTDWIQIIERFLGGWGCWFDRKFISVTLV